MVTERKPSNTRGWSEVWDERQSQIRSAARKVKRLVDQDPSQFQDVSFSTGDKTFKGSGRYYKSVSVEPSQTELESAPRAIKRVLKDLGITSQDKVSVELREEFLGFDFTVRPQEVTADRVGMTLSTNPCRAALIASIESTWKSEDGKVVTDTFVHGIGDDPFYLFQGERPTMIMESYGDVFHNYQANDPRSWNPNMVKMLTEAANWGADLVTSRKKPNLT